MTKIPFLISSCMCFLSATAADVSSEGELLFKSEFAQNKELKGWTDVYQKSPPKSEWYKVEDVGGESVLKTAEVLFGISHKLKRDLLVDESVVEITLDVALRKPTPPKGHQVGIALSSRDTAAMDAGGPFWKGKDSGVMAQGYNYDDQSANFIFWQVEGNQTRMHPSRQPFNLLPEAGKWTTWRLVYKHRQKELWFYRSAKDNEPFMIQRRVDLSGVALGSVWLCGWSTEFMDVSVRCLRN